jgi:hypothetical protein
MSSLELEVIPDQQAVAVQPLTKALAEVALDAGSASTVMAAFTPYWHKAKTLVAKAQDLLDNPIGDGTDAKAARVLRLALKGERTAAENTRKGLKDHTIKYNRAVDGVNAVLVLLTKPMEDKLEAIEQAEAIAEANRKEALKIERTEALRPFGVSTEFISVEVMDEATFARMLADAKLTFEAKIALEAKLAEEQRIAAEKAEADRLAAEKLEAERRAAAAEFERIAREEMAKVEAENARLKAEKDAIEAKAKAEREAAEKEAKEAARKAAAKAKAEKDELEAKAKAARDAIVAKAAEEKAEAEKLAHIERIKREALERAEADRLSELARQTAAAAEAARVAAAAPDADKLFAFADLVEALVIPTLETPEAKVISDSIAKAIVRLGAVIRVQALSLGGDQ